MPGNRKEGFSCKENTCQERETKRKKIHNITSLKFGGWEGARINSLETWKRKPARACLREKWQRALQEWLSISFTLFLYGDEPKRDVTNAGPCLLTHLEL